MQDFDVEYGDQSVTLSGLENCSITALMREAKSFYETDLLEAMMAYVSPGDYVVDIGAHIGNHTLFFAKVMGANVLAIEANPKAYTILKNNVAKNELQAMVNALNVAASFNADPVTLTPLSGEDPGTYSILREPKPNKSFTCKAITLDGDLEKYFITHPPSLIKLDIEGAEAGVLGAALKTIETYKPALATEVFTTVEFDNIVKVVVPLGYHPVSVHNSTVMIIWEHRIGDAPTQTDLNNFLYAIKKSSAVNSLSVSNSKYSERIEMLEKELKQSSG